MYIIILFLSFIKLIFQKYDYNDDINVETKLESDKKTIVMIFAGRKKYLDILMISLNNLYKNNKIHEIHFWQFTNNLNDIKYLESISNIHKTSSQFTEDKNIFPEIKKNKFLIGIKITKGGAYLLLNDKSEIIFNIDNSIDSIFINIIKNERIQKKVKKFQMINIYSI